MMVEISSRIVMRFLVLLALTVALAACSTVAERVPEPDRSPETRAPAPRADGHSVVGIAKKHLGTPYRWGGATPAGFDCSGFVQYVYAQVGVALPHNAAQQYKQGRPVARDRLAPGDLVFFDGLRHNGIYVGDGRFIHARRAGKRVSISALGEDWYAERWVGARRL